MRRQLLAITALGVLLLAVVPAGAASKGDLHLRDDAGDANGINSQGGFLPIPSISTAPASVPGADILSIDVTTIYTKVGKKQVPHGTAVAMHLTGPVMTGVNYLLTASLSATCDGTSKTIQLGYQDFNKFKSNLAICQSATTAGTSKNIGSVVANGNTVTWTLDPILKPGGTFTHFYASASVEVLGVLDECTAAGTYTYAK